MSLFFHAEDGYYSLTKPGIIAFLVIACLLLFLAAFLIGGKKEKKQLFSTKQLVFSAIAIALAYATSYIKFIDMPWGGSVTLMSMLFIVLIGYWYGLKIGLICGLSYGILQFLQGSSYILTPLQVCLDYLVAFAALGLSGLFSKKKNGLLIGYIVAIFARGAFHAIGGYLYWMEYMPDNFPKSLTAVYPILYNYSYILLEGAITIVILLLPPIKKAMAYVKKMAND